MTNEKAAIIIGNIPIDGKDDSYTVAEYQEAKAMEIHALSQEPCTDAQERYKDLCEYFGDAKVIQNGKHNYMINNVGTLNLDL